MTNDHKPVTPMLSSLRRLDEAKGALRVEDVYDTEIDDLWSALTDPCRLERWVAVVEGDLRTGGHIQARFTSTWSGPSRIDICEPPRHLLLTMEPGTPDETVIEAVLSTVGARTRLVIEQRGLPLADLPGRGAGWQAHVEALTAYLSGRQPGPWRERWVTLTAAYEALGQPSRGPAQGGTGPVSDGSYQPVVVARQINAPASEIFQILADPARHIDIDGSGMLRGATSPVPISGTGDVFVMKMYYSQLGDYEMNNHVVEYELDRRLGWEPEAGHGHPNAGAGAAQRRLGQRWTFELTPVGSDATIVTETYDCSQAPEERRVGMDNGKVWTESMTKTLERLDALCTRQAG